MAATGVKGLRFLYVGVDAVEVALAFYTEVLGAHPRWRFQRFGADVAGVELGDGTLVLLADHRPDGSVLPIWAVEDLAALQDGLQARGATVSGPDGTPEGDVIVVAVPGGSAGAGHEVAFIEVVRPDALDGAFDDPANPHRIPTS